MPTVKEVLIAARSIIHDPEHWTQESYAIDNCGCEVYPDESNAYAFCSAGALAKVSGTSFDTDDGTIHETLEYRAGYESLRRAADILFGLGSVTALNDTDDFEVAHVKVLAMFDRAIADA